MLTDLQGTMRIHIGAFYVSSWTRLLESSLGSVICGSGHNGIHYMANLIPVYGRRADFCDLHPVSRRLRTSQLLFRSVCWARWLAPAQSHQWSRLLGFHICRLHIKHIVRWRESERTAASSGS